MKIFRGYFFRSSIFIVAGLLLLPVPQIDAANISKPKGPTGPAAPPPNPPPNVKSPPKGPAKAPVHHCPGTPWYGPHSRWNCPY